MSKIYIAEKFKLLAVTCMLCIGVLYANVVSAQASIATSGVPVVENFSSYMGTSTLPANWTTTGASANGNTFQGTNQTGGASGGWYGNANMSYLGSGSATNGNATWRLINNTGNTITSFTVSFVARMWKSGSASPVCSLTYSTNSTGTVPAAGALTAITTFSDATANISTGTTISTTINAVSIAAGDYIYLRFLHPGNSSSDNIGWDDVSITVTSTPTMLYWDANGATAGIGGTGTWGNTFSPSVTGNVATINTDATSTAYFQSPVGTVTLAAAQTAKILNITTDGYKFGATGTQTLTVADATSGFNLSSKNITFTGTGNLAVNGIITGTGTAANTIFIKEGTGTLTLNTGNTFTGKLLINGGLVASTGESAFGASPASFTANQITLDGGGIQASTGNINFSSNRGITLGAAGGIFNAASGRTITLTNVVTGTGSLEATGAGIVLMAGSHTYTGETIITGGILRLNAAERISNSSDLTLNGGTFSSGATTGFSETMATLNLAANSTIALGTGNHTITFDNSSAITWTGNLLTVTGWTGTAGNSGTAGKIFVGNNTAGLTADQLAAITFTGFTPGAVLLPTGELVPAVPAGTITVAAQPKGPYCNASSNSISLDYTITGTVTAPYIELSDATGSFSGTTTNLGGTVTGSGPYTITGTIPAAQAPGTAYRVRVVSTNTTPIISANNGSNITITAAATPTVAIVVSPSNTVCENTSVTFTATPANLGSGTVNATSGYQWRINGGDVAGQTASTFTTNTLATGDVVSCVIAVTGGCVTTANATSNNITMTINAAAAPSVSIVSNDADNIICAGSSITFTATPVNGGTAPSYQWKVDGGNVTGTGATYTTTTLTSGQVVSVTLTSNFACAQPTTANSNTITINVNPAPATPVVTTLNNCGSSDLSFTSPGGETYYWQTSATGQVMTNAANPYTVTTNGTYYLRAYNNTTGCWSVARSVVVTISRGPTVTTQPTTQSVTAPAAATFTVVAANAAGYQWQVNTGSGFTNIAGATSATYNTGATTVAMNGYVYKCIIKGIAPCGDNSTNSVTLNVAAGPCGGETFTNLNAATGTYTAGSYVGDNGLTWTYTQARTVTSTYNITGTSFGFSDAGTGYVRATSSSGGVGVLTFSMTSYFTGGVASDRVIEVWVNGTLKGTYTLAAMSTDYTYNVTANETGAVLVEFRSTGSRQVVIDDVSWTCYAGACAPSTTVTAFTPQTGPVGTMVTITGTGFGTTPATGGVKFGSVLSTSYTVVDANTITAEVPSGVSATSAISVSNAGGCFSNPFGTYTLIAAVGTCSTMSDLIISEVYDQESGNNHYIEIYNGTGTTINLDGPDYELSVMNNPAGVVTTWDISGTIAPGQVLVYYGGTNGGLATGTQSGSGTGFNDGNDEVRLLKNGSIIDRMIGPDEKGFTYKRKNTVTGPTAVYTASQWDILLNETTDDIGLFTASAGVVITTHPLDQTCSFSMTVAASGGPTAYQWKYYNTTTNTWVNVTTAAFPGTTIPASGIGSATSTTLTISGDIAAYYNYQFYCEVRESASCTKASNAAQFMYSTMPIYRSNVTSGNWSAPGSWMMSTNGSLFFTTCTYPVALNSASVIIQNGQSIILDKNLDIDKLTIDAGGTLEISPSAKLTIKNSQAGADLFVNGTLYDRGNSSNGIAFEDNTGTANDATWSLTGTVIKTSTSSVSNYKDFYQGGMSTIPATANWIYRYNGDNPTVTVASIGMFYPNLTYESTNGAHDATGSLEQFTGASGITTVKGTLDIGGTGSGTVKFYNNNSNASPMLVNGNMIIRNGSTLSNAGTTAGTGFEVKGNVTVDGSLIVNGNNSGTLSLTGTAAQNVSGTGNAQLYNYVMNNTSAGGITYAADSTAVYKSYTLSGNTKLAMNAGSITLKSIGNNTAYVAPITGGTITYTAGTFEVERDLPAIKAWRFLATPLDKTTSPSITSAWREDGSLVSTGYGTQITGPGGSVDMDGVTGAYSMKWYNDTTNTFVPVKNTNDPIANLPGYMVYVRGDRATGINGTTVATNLRISGQLRTGNQLFPIAADKFQSIGNPYASAMSFPSLLAGAGNSGLSTYYIAWDPSLNGSYASGGYQTLSAIDGFKATAAGPAGVSTIFIVGQSYPDIQSGQAFYVHNATNAPFNVTVRETMKTTGSMSVSRENTPGDRQFLRTKLYTNTGAIADGNLVAFDDEFSNALDADDALKFNNGGENIGISSVQKILSVEARNRIHAEDTIQYNMTNIRQQQYKLEIVPENFVTTGMDAFFIDKFLNTRTPLNLADTNTFYFNGTADAASVAAGRFMIVFKAAAGPLPVNFISVAATRNTDRSIVVNWRVENELNIEQYVVERSADGINFTGILSKDATNSSTYSQRDLSPLAADNFYRIRATVQDGRLQYSSVVKVGQERGIKSISVYPNPVEGKTAQLMFVNQPAGEYDIQVFNQLGQVVFKIKAKVSGNNFVLPVSLGENVAAGVYELRTGRIGEKAVVLRILVK